MRKSIVAAVLALSIPGALAAAPAVAAPHGQAPADHSVTAAGESWNHSDRRGWGRRDHYRGRDRDRYYRDSRYYGARGYDGPRTWRGDDGRYYCRRDDGTTGLIVGGAVGGLLGNEIAGRGDRTLGTILGVAGGALLGREIDRGGSRCR